MSDGSSRSTLVASLVIHAVVLGLFLLLTTVFKRSDPGPDPVEVVFYKPGEYVPPPPPPEPAVVPEPEPEPEPEVKVAQREPDPIPEIRPEPEPAKPIEVAKLEPPPAPEPEPEPVKPEKPRREVKTNLLNAAITKPATKLPAREHKTTTGSFGNTETEPAKEPVRTRLRGGTRVGNFVVDEKAQPKRTARRATVQTSGFGATEQAPERRDDATLQKVATGGFGSTQTAQKRPRAGRKVATEAPDTPVEVLSKPTPVYTAEAREQRVEGEVTLRVTFVASGQVKVLEVVGPLGHGLDEAAIDAAKRIRFKPARRDGRPVDHTTTVRIVFQLV